MTDEDTGVSTDYVSLVCHNAWGGWGDSGGTAWKNYPNSATDAWLAGMVVVASDSGQTCFATYLNTKNALLRLLHNVLGTAVIATRWTQYRLNCC